MKTTAHRISLAVLLFFTVLPGQSAGIEALKKWVRQTVYVPLYSHIYADERYRDKPFLLTATLSVRNTDPDTALTLLEVNYHDSNGKLLQAYLDSPITIGPLGSTRYIVQESETKGGSGAKFLVRWQAATGVTEPIIESIMIGTKMQQGISFVSRGRVIKGRYLDK
ncbi:MAG: hypothetical protein CSA34_06130 [Desulfobulbus propionicus]|nr:MAG: hypothetical protein CSA34_06130 [Desulfobulbus propionicus]